MTSLPINTTVFPVIRSDLIIPALRSFWEFNDRDLHRVIVIDQTQHGLADLVNAKLAHIHLRIYKNLGFAGAANRGFRLADTEYVTISNDDCLWFDSRWFQGIEEIFTRVKNAIAVNPSCPKIPGWSLGKKEPEYIGDMDTPAKCLEDGAWERLIKETPYRGFVRGICMWATTFSMPRLREFGIIGSNGQVFDESYFPGGSEDYDLNARIFRAGGTALGTHMSWLWHWWGKTKDEKDHDGMVMVSQRPSWNRIGDHWEPGFTVQGGSARKTDKIYVESL